MKPPAEQRESIVVFFARRRGGLIRRRGKYRLTCVKRDGGRETSRSHALVSVCFAANNEPQASRCPPS